MKKYGYLFSLLFLLFILLSNSVMAVTHSSVILNGGGDVLPSKSVNVSLGALAPSATYNIICYIDTQYPFQVVRFGSHFSDDTSFISFFSLNGDEILQGQLRVGHNVAVIAGSFTNPSTASISFTNLDQDNLFNVNNCYAIPTS